MPALADRLSALLQGRLELEAAEAEAALEVSPEASPSHQQRYSSSPPVRGHKSHSKNTTVRTDNLSDDDEMDDVEDGRAASKQVQKRPASAGGSWQAKGASRPGDR